MEEKKKSFDKLIFEKLETNTNSQAVFTKMTKAWMKKICIHAKVKNFAILRLQWGDNEGSFADSWEHNVYYVLHDIWLTSQMKKKLCTKSNIARIMSLVSDVADEQPEMDDYGDGQPAARPELPATGMRESIVDGSVEDA